ncbi:g3202 [Coccomyxa elongata]
MEFNDSQKYAAAALFTLSLHRTQEETGATWRHGGEDGHLRPWGAPRGAETANFSAEPPAGEDDAASAAWDAFWGWDCCAPGGLCERVYAHLGISESSWPALKMLPAMMQQDTCSQAVKQYRDLIDSSFADTPVPEAPKPSRAEDIPEAPGHATAVEGLAEVTEESDEDLEADRRRAHLAARPVPAPTANAHNTPAGQGSHQDSNEMQSKAEKNMHSHGAAEFSREPIHISMDDTRSASELSAAADGKRGASGPSAESLGAIMTLLDACLSTHHMPTLQDVVSQAQEKGKPKEPKQSNFQEPGVRWYDARARVALRRVALWLRVPSSKLPVFECLLAQEAQVPEVKGEVQKESKWGSRMRYAKIGAAAVGGGALLAVTGGLAAPALAAVAGSVMTTAGAGAAAGALTGFVGSSVGAAAVIGGFGAGGAHAVGSRMARRLGDIKEFGFREVRNTRLAPGEEPPPLQPAPIAPPGTAADPRLALTVCVSGMVASEEEFVSLWRGVSDADTQRMALVWESQELLALNKSIMAFIKDQAAQMAGKWFIEKFLVHGLIAAISLPMTVLSVSSIIDAQWNVVSNRAVLAGQLLAHVLMSGAHGGRPVTLIGYSMGARLVFHCLLELCRCRAKGIVEHAVLLGAPVGVTPERWAMARSVVAGRLVNGYSPQDWVLGLSFRARELTLVAAGLAPVRVTGIENVNLHVLVKAHNDYSANMDAILDLLGFAGE